VNVRDYALNYNKALTLAKQRKTPPRVIDPKRVQDYHHEVVRRLVIGDRPKDIAADLKLDVSTIYALKNSPMIEEKVNLLQAVRDEECVEIAREIQEFAPKALKLIHEVIVGEGEGEGAPIALRVRAAQTELDRAGFSPVRKFQGEMINAHLTLDEVNEIKSRAREARRAGVVIDVTAEK